MSIDADQRFPEEPKPGLPPRRRWWPSCLAGCLVVGLLSLLVCGGAAWYLAKNMKSIASGVARRAIVNAVEQSELEPAEKRAIIAEVDRVVNQYRTGQITLDDLGRVLEELAKSPVMQSIVVFAVDKQYIEPSGLTDEEKKAARLTLRRVVRGLYEEKIKEGDLGPALDHLSTKTPGGQRQMKDRVSDAVLRKFLAECQRLADQAGIPSEPGDIKISEEFRKAIDRALRPPPKSAAPAGEDAQEKPATPASADVPYKPAAPASGDAPRPNSPKPGTTPVEKEDPTASPRGTPH